MIPADGFLWIDAVHDEVTGDSTTWRTTIERMTGTRLYEPHLLDAVNLGHPSYFDATESYAMLVFRKLAIDDRVIPESNPTGGKRKIPPALTKLATKPVTFLLMERALVTVRPARSRTLEAFRDRMLEYKPRSENGNAGLRMSNSPAELALRLLRRFPIISIPPHWG